MNILYLSSLFPPAIGGAENYVKWTSEGLARHGEKVSVFTTNALHGEDFFSLKSSGDLPPEDLINHVYIRRFPVHRLLSTLCSHKTDKIRGIYRLKEILFGETLGFWQHGPVVHGMLQAIKDHKPDLLVAVNNYFFTTYIAYLARKNYGIPLIIIPLSHVSNEWASAPILKKIYKMADAVIVSTDFEKNYLVNQGTNDNKVHVLGHGIDPAEFENADGERFRLKYGISQGPLVSFIGRKINGKGAGTLVKAMRLVWKHERNAQLALVGPDGRGSGSVLSHLLNQLTPEERKKTFNIDRFSDEEKKDIYAASDIFAMPSNIDSFGLVFLEAWRSGLPVIACRNTPQESYMEHGKDALLVKYGDAEQLAKAIRMLLTDRHLRINMGRYGRKKFFERYTLDTYVKNIRDVYRQVIQKNTAAIPPSLDHEDFLLSRCLS